MDTYNYNRKKPDKLFLWLICISVGIHGLAFARISGLYSSSAMQDIELTLEDLSKPFSRSIPRPTFRPKKTHKPLDVKKIQIKPTCIPKIQPMKINPVDNSLSSDLMETISAPDLTSDMQGGDIYAVSDFLETGTDFTNTKSYFEMVKLKIETSRHYPETAMSTRKEGRVTVGFILTLKGDVREVKIVNDCRYGCLNQAAMKAVYDAAPFPRPPLKFFKQDIPLEFTILFEII